MDKSFAPSRNAPPLSIRLSFDERDKLEASAKKADLKLSAYARQLLIGDADELDDLISNHGRQRHLPDMETISGIALANIKLNKIAEALHEAHSQAGSIVTLRFLTTQMEEVQDTLNKIRRSRV